MDTLLTLNPGMIIWTFITFGILLWVLKRFGWKPLLNSLEKREERIHADIQRSEHAREEAERLLSEHKKMMNAAEIEARKIIDESRKTAEKLKADIVDAASAQAAQITVQAKSEIQREKETALAQLRGEVADLAILAASRILQESMDDARNRTLVENFISGLPKN
jgi:F-type H+-transporting ATPase subunit b